MSQDLEFSPAEKGLCPHGPHTGLLLQADPAPHAARGAVSLPGRPHPGVEPADEAAWPLAAPLHARHSRALCRASALHASVPLHGRPLLSGRSSASKSPPALLSCPGAPVPRWPESSPRAGRHPTRVAGSLHTARCLAALQEMPTRPWDRLPGSPEIRRLARRAKETRVGTGQDGAALTRQVGPEAFSPLQTAHSPSAQPHQARAAPPHRQRQIHSQREGGPREAPPELRGERALRCHLLRTRCLQNTRSPVLRSPSQRVEGGPPPADGSWRLSQAWEVPGPLLPPQTPVPRFSSRRGARRPA